MALTEQQKARLKQFSAQQSQNKTGSVPKPATPKPSIYDQIKANNTARISGNITPTTQTTVTETKPSIYDQMKKNNAGIIAQHQQSQKTDDVKAVDDAVNYANSLFSQTLSPLDQIAQQEKDLANTATSFYQEMMKRFEEFAGSSQTSFEDMYKKTINSEQFKQQETDLADKKAKIEELDLQIEGVEADVRTELQGKASESAIQQRVAQRVRDLNNQKARLVDDYTQIYDVYSSEKAQAIELFNIRLQDAQRQEDRQRKVFEQKYNMTKDVFNVNRQVAMKGIERQEQAYWKGKDMEDKLQLMQLDQEQRKEAMLWEYNLQKQMKGKTIQWIDVNGSKIAVDGDDPTKILATYGNNPFSYNDSLNQASLQAVIDACVEGSKQCGAFVNDYLQNAGGSRVLGNSYESKKSLINSKVPQPGAVFVMPSKIAPEYGHTGIVESVNEDGTINIVDANWDGDGKVGRRTISHLSVDGYYIPPVQSDTGPSFNDKYGPLYNSYMVSDTAPSNKVVEELGGMERFADNAIKYYIKNTAARIGEMGYTLDNPTRLVSANKDDKKNLYNDLSQYSYLVNTLDTLIADIQTNGIPTNTVFGRGALMAGKSRDIQAYLKGDKVYALGVLNGPDLKFLEQVMPTIGSVTSNLAGKDTVLKQLEEVKTGVLSRYKTAFETIGISYVGKNSVLDAETVFATNTLSGASSFLDANLKK